MRRGPEQPAGGHCLFRDRSLSTSPTHTVFKPSTGSRGLAGGACQAARSMLEPCRMVSKRCLEPSSWADKVRSGWDAPASSSGSDGGGLGVLALSRWRARPPSPASKPAMFSSTQASDRLMSCRTVQQRGTTEAGMAWDILIRHGPSIDGSARPGSIGDIAINAGCIAAFGPCLAGDAKQVIDADGLVVTPGFIDIKTHSDFVLPINPRAESKVR